MSAVDTQPRSMGAAGIIAAARADFLQRVRSLRFLVVLMATVALGMLMLPTEDAGYVVLQVGQARGIYGSAWVGLVFGVIGSTILPLLGFFVIKDALARDRSTRVGLVLAASPMRRMEYLGAKLLSHMSVFVAILAVSSLVAFAMQLWRGEDTAIHPVDLLLHLWLVPLPVLFATSAIALLFESVPGLRGAFGNVVYFFLWVLAFGPTMVQMESDQSRLVHRSADFYGISAPLADFEEHIPAGPLRMGGLSIGANIGAAPPTPVPWSGIANDGQWIAERGLWLLLTLPILLIAALFFDRFDPARGGKRRPEPASPPSQDHADFAPRPWHALTPISSFATRWRPLTQLRAELALLLRRRSFWWYAVLVGLWITGIAISANDAVKWVVPIAWLWGLTAFSEHGARADIHGTRALLASAPAPLFRQLPVQWLAATVFALVLVAPVMVKLIVLGSVGTAAQVIVGAAFVAASTLALGAVSGGSRLFELIFLMLWYAAMQDVPGARFSGNPDLAFAASHAPAYLVIAAALFALAWILGAATLRR